MPVHPPLKVAVIGCGAIAHEHLSYLASSPRVVLAGVCDVSKVTAAFIAERYHAEQAFTDSGKMLETVSPDVVHVLTPPHTHGPLVAQALEAGAHVICEKPLTGTAAETEALLGLAKRQRRRLIESTNMLFHDSVLAIGKLIAAGRLGSVLGVDVLVSLDLTTGVFGDQNLQGPGVRLPAGAVQDFLPHLAYLFLHFAGYPDAIERVEGFLANRSGNPRVGFDHLEVALKAGQCCGRLRISSGEIPHVFRIVVRGTQGTAEADFFNPYLRFQGLPNVGKRAPIEQIASGLKLARNGFANLRDKVLQHGPYHGIPRMLEATYRSLQEDDDTPGGEAHILATARLIDRIVALKDLK